MTGTRTGNNLLVVPVPILKRFNSFKFATQILQTTFIRFAALFILMQTNPVTENPMSSTNIRVDVETRDRIAKLGGYDDTADMILRRVLDFYEKQHKDKKD